MGSAGVHLDKIVGLEGTPHNAKHRLVVAIHPDTSGTVRCQPYSRDGDASVFALSHTQRLVDDAAASPAEGAAKDAYLALHIC